MPATPPLRLTASQCRAIDRIAIDTFGVPSIVLMENASRGLAAVAHRMLGAVDGSKPIHILVGPGNNGGDGLAAARHLSNMGHTIQLHLLSEELSPDAAIHHRICQAMNLPMSPLLTTDPATFSEALLIDCLFGTGLSRPLDGALATWINSLNAMPLGRRPAVLAADIPTGLSADTGEPLGTVLLANHTVTFAAEKLGFVNPASRRYTGVITVVDIGCPQQAITLAAQP